MRWPLWRRNQERELGEEVRAHMEMAIRDAVERGESRAQAEAAARRQFGNELLIRETAREQWGWVWLEQLAQDLRYGARMLARSPGFTLIAVLTLALGIGANTTLFSMVNAVLLNPLPYPHPEQLVTLHMSKPNFEMGAVSYPNFKDWQAQNHSFSAMALSRVTSVNLIGAGEPEHFRGNFITADFFSLLGVSPVIGRHLAPGEDQIGGPALVEISEGLWKRRFGGTADVLGKSVNLSGNSYTIIGVVPASFDLQLMNFTPTDIYLPIGQWQNSALKMRGPPLGLHGIGRLQDGVTLQQARADMEAVSRSLAAAFPDTNAGARANLIPLRHSMLGEIQPVLLLLLGAVGFVLLIACVNVASLLLARSESRKREFSVRAALGASRTRMMRQLLTESLLLAGAGGGLGVLLAQWGTRASLAALPRSLPRAGQVHMDGRVLLFSAAASLLAGIVFGIAPALKGAHCDVQQGLQSSSRRASSRQTGAQHALVVLEIALALVLLVGAGLMLQSLMRLWRVDPGFDAHNVMQFGISLPPSAAAAPPAAVRSTLRAMLAAMESTPGVEAASFSDAGMPLETDDEMLFWLAGQPQPKSDGEMNWSLRYMVQPSYLRIMKLPLLRGRFFNPQDTEKSPPVVVVDDVFAATFFPQQEALGKRIVWRANNRSVEAEVVGVVGHVKHWGLDADDSNSLRAQVYQSFDQYSDDSLPTGNTAAVVRTSGPPLAVVASLKQHMQQVNGESVLYSPSTLEQVIGRTLSMRQFSMVLLASFAGLALLLASIGLYGVIAYLVGQQTQEFGIRMALGAQPRNVLALVMGRGTVLALAGIALGVAAALGLTRLLSKLLFGITPTDPATFASVAALLLLVALAACYIPARRAMRVDPMVALRYE